MLLKQHRGLSRRRDYPNPVGEVSLRIVELEHGIFYPPHPLVGQYRQVVRNPDDHALVAAAGYPLAGAFEAPLYLFSGRRLPPFLLADISSLSWTGCKLPAPWCETR